MNFNPQKQMLSKKGVTPKTERYERVGRVPDEHREKALEVVLLENRLEDIRTIYNDAKDADTRDILHYYREPSDVFRGASDKFLDPYVKVGASDFLGGYASMWCRADDTSRRCNGWHLDGDSYSGGIPFIISAYPAPTEILLPVGMPNYDFNYHSSCHGSHEKTNDAIDDALKRGTAMIFTPEPGDVYYIGASVLHRGSAADDNVEHMFMRYHSPRMQEKWQDVINAAPKAYELAERFNRVAVA